MGWKLEVVSVAVSPDGASPALARELRNLIDGFLTDGIGVLAETLAGRSLAP